MPRRHPNHRLVKIHRNYTVGEAADLLGKHKNTVRAWIRASGLRVIDSRRPVLIHGLDLREFLREQRTRNRQTCPPGHIYCVKCRAPREPAGDMADYLPLTDSSGNLRGICPDCGILIHRRVGLAKIDQVRGRLEITIPQGESHIRDRANASENCDFDKGNRIYDNAQSR
jgi:excisionase family DNA binding protein